MRAEELRIGNLIFDPKRGRVKGIPARYVSHRIISDMASNPDQDWFKPIPLTEEWLLNFGFRRHKTKYNDNYTIGSIDGSVYSVQIREGVFFYSDDASDAGCYVIRSVEYVHQLQNLHYAITGEELKTEQYDH